MMLPALRAMGCGFGLTLLLLLTQPAVVRQHLLAEAAREGQPPGREYGPKVVASHTGVPVPDEKPTSAVSGRRPRIVDDMPAQSAMSPREPSAARKYSAAGTGSPERAEPAPPRPTRVTSRSRPQGAGAISGISLRSSSEPAVGESSKSGGTHLFIDATPPPPRVSGHAKASETPVLEMEPIEDVPSTNGPEDRRPVVFYPLPYSQTISPRRDDPRLELQLASLEQKIQQLAQAQTDRNARELERATQLLQQLQQATQMQGLQQQLQQLQQLQSPLGGPAPSSPAAVEPPNSNPAEVLPRPQTGTNPGGGQAGAPPGIEGGEPARPVILNARPSDVSSEKFSLQIQEAEITQVLDLLGQTAGLNILVGRGVQGRVPSVNLQNVTIEQALDGIVRSLGLVYEREADFIFVMTHEEARARKQLGRKLVTKIYRPNYISVADLQALVAPLLTPTVGKIAITAPSDSGIEADSEQAGGDRLSQTDALLVQDYPEVLAEIDEVLVDMDVPPMQVVIEAMILSVRLTDDMEFGVNFALLNGNSDNLIVSGNGQTLGTTSGFPGVSDDTILPPVGQFIADTAGLKYGFISGDVSLFLNALESITDTNLIASPQLRVLNKQKAQLIIGDRLSYTTTTFQNNQSIQNVNFLDTGTKLILRPYISSDGLVRMEIHPERSSGTINPQSGLPNVQTTEVTTNVMVRDGTTVVIGGLIEEQVSETQNRVPFLGALPVVGNVFRNKTENITRNELIVLITPRVVREPEDAVEGESVKFENERRADYFRNELSPINRRNLARIEFERALYFFEKGDLLKARAHIDRSLHYHKNDLEALRLRDQIELAIAERREKWLPLPSRQPTPAPMAPTQGEVPHDTGPPNLPPLPQ